MASNKTAYELALATAYDLRAARDAAYRTYNEDCIAMDHAHDLRLAMDRSEEIFYAADAEYKEAVNRCRRLTPIPEGEE